MINQKTYLNRHSSLSDKIILSNRLKMVELIKNYLINKDLFDILDIGSTNDKSKSSNLIIKKLDLFQQYNSISDQKIEDDFFKKKLKKSITDNFTDNEIEMYKSDVVISNATIEHVGSTKNQIKMCKNIINLAKRYFIIITPNRLHPLEFHTKIPLLHWMPKKIHRKILKFLGHKFLAKEENLNLLTKKDLKNFMTKLNQKNYLFIHIRFLFFKSNIILIGRK